MTTNSPTGKSSTPWIIAIIAGIVLVLCICGVAGVFVFGNLKYFQNRLAARPTNPPLPTASILEPTDTLEPGAQLIPSETPAIESTQIAPTQTPPIPGTNPIGLVLWTTTLSDTLNNQIVLYQQNHPNVTISVTMVAKNNIMNLWRQGVSNGTAPDLMLADNSELWKLVKAQAVQPLDEIQQDNLSEYTKTALDGMTVDGKVYGIPVRFELAGFYYNTSMVDSPPATTSELSLMYRTNHKFGIVKSPYYMMGWFLAYGGAIADKNGRCASTPTGFEDALNLMRQIRKYGSFLVDDPAIIRGKFEAEQIGMIVDTSAELPEFAQALGPNLASAPIPAATQPASPIVQETGFYMNPKGQNFPEATNLALALSSAQAQTAYMDDYWVPTRNDVQVKDAAIKGFVQGAKNGFPIPQASWFSNWAGPFQDMINQVLSDQFAIPDAIRIACTNMDKLNNK
jgi:arabinogalactan oligomer/maltooligosaccharide transport system substrate-binding protein